jgi:hypothetical protein
MRIPANIVMTNKYTIGKEYMYANSYKEYQGYYYELGSKRFAGREPTIDAPELIPINSPDNNILLTRKETYAYGKLSPIQIIKNKKPTSVVYDYNRDTRYFCTKTNVIPTIIQEVDKNNFNQIQNNPLYISVSLSFIGGFDDSELNEAEKKIPGIKAFVNTSYLPPPVEEGGEVG